MQSLEISILGLWVKCAATMILGRGTTTPALLANIILALFVTTNALSYHSAVLITSAKSFIVQSLELSILGLWVKCSATKIPGGGTTTPALIANIKLPLFVMTNALSYHSTVLITSAQKFYGAIPWTLDPGIVSKVFRH